MANKLILLDILFTLVSLTFVIIAIYFATRTAYFSLPVPIISTFFSIIIPLITYPFIRLIGFNIPLSPNTTKHTSLARLTSYLLLTINIIILTLSANGISLPSTLQTCVLRDRWVNLFQTKNARAVRRIQDAMDCCGFRSSRDMAWPFKDKDHGDEECEIAFRRTKPCEGDWQSERLKIMAFMVVVGTFGIIAIATALPGVREFWTSRTSSFPFKSTSHAHNRLRIANPPAGSSQDRLLPAGSEGDVAENSREAFRDDLA